MENKKEKTAPDVSVGADTEQPISKKTTSSISEYEGNIKSFEEMQREMQLSLDPSYLKTISMNELFDTQYGSKQPLIDGLLYPGTYIFAGLPKLGKSFLMAHTKLIIIDTLQKVREVGGDNYSYANDYQIMARLKSFADAHCLCMLLVHHTRKQNADDKFDMISGTSGLLGAADGAFLLQKEKRTGNAATLEVSGRDQQDQKLYLVRNTETLLWDLQRAETELWKEPPEPLLDEIAELVLKENPYWEGSATELVSLVKVEIQPHVITRKLNVLAGRLYIEHGIYFRSERTHEGRKLRFWKDVTDEA